MTASIVTDKGEGPVVGSMNLVDSEVNTAIALSNADNSGVEAWKWEIIDSPEPSILHNPLPAPVFSAVHSITPDVIGHTVLFRLTTYKDVARSQVDDIDTKVITVSFPDPFNWVIPAAGQSVEKDALRGWASDINRFMRDVRNTIVDPIDSGDYKNSVLAATAVALPAYTRVGSVITADANGAFPTVDTVTVPVGKSFLDKNNANKVDRGIYVLDVLGDGSTPWSATRREDFDTDPEVTAMALIPVEEGAENGPSGVSRYQLITPDPILINVTELTFDASGGGSGAGITIYDDAATLTVVSVLTVPAGTLSWMASVEDMWVLREDADGFAVGNDFALGVLIPDVPVGQKYWSRLRIGSEKARQQAAWFVDFDTGDDEDTGLTLGTALKNQREIFARLGNTPKAYDDVAITIVALDPSSDDSKLITDGSWIFPEGASLQIYGSISELDSGTLTASVDRNGYAKVTQHISDPGSNMHLHVGKRIRLTATNNYAWISDQDGTGEVSTSAFLGGVPVGNEAFSVEELTVTLDINNFKVVSSGSVEFHDLKIFSENGVRNNLSTIFFRCLALSGLAFINVGPMFFENCRFENGASWLNCHAGFKNCSFAKSFQAVGSHLDFDLANDFAEDVNRSLKTPASFVDLTDIGGGNIFAVTSTGEIFAQGTGGVNVGMFISEGDVLLIADGGLVKGPASGTFNIGVHNRGHIYYEDPAAPGHTLDLIGNDADVVVGGLNKHYVDMPFTDLGTGACVQPRPKIVLP